MKRLLLRIRHSFKGHDWKLEHGCIHADDYYIYSQLLGRKTTTYTLHMGDRVHIWGWSCPCGATREATKEEVENADNTKRPKV